MLITTELQKAIDELGRELGVEMIVHEAVTVGAVKEIGGMSYGDYAIVINTAVKDGSWVRQIQALKAHLTELFREAEGGGEDG